MCQKGLKEQRVSSLKTPVIHSRALISSPRFRVHSYSPFFLPSFLFVVGKKKKKKKRRGQLFLLFFFLSLIKGGGEAHRLLAWHPSLSLKPGAHSLFLWNGREERLLNGCALSAAGVGGSATRMGERGEALWGGRGAWRRERCAFASSEGIYYYSKDRRKQKTRRRACQPWNLGVRGNALMGEWVGGPWKMAVWREILGELRQRGACRVWNEERGGPWVRKGSGGRWGTGAWDER